MAAFLSGLFSKKQKEAQRRRTMARELHGQVIRYVTTRKGDTDEVIGRGGNLTLRGDEFLLFSSGEILLRTPVASLDASYLMSGDGVVITAPNMEDGGREISLIAHFVYHRK